MKNLSRILLYTLLIAGVAIGGYYFMRLENFGKRQSIEEATVLLEKMRKVSKLVTTEAHLSEIYNYKEYYYYDISPFRKKVLLRVNAKISAGYDFDDLSITIHEKNRTIILDSIPEPRILSVDHEMDYYDLQEGTFNAFTAEELTDIQRRAKKFVEEKAIENRIFDEAENQKNEYLEMLNLLVETMGWKLVVTQETLLD